MGRPPLQKIHDILERTCPTCGTTITYGSKYTASKAENVGKVCKECAMRAVAQSSSSREKHRQYGHAHKDEVIARMRAGWTEESRQRHRESIKAYYSTEEGRLKQQKKGLDAHADPGSKFNTEEHKTRRREFALKGLQIAHQRRSPFSKGEKVLAELLKSDGFELNSGRQMIEGCIPDIVHRDKKIIVEYYGDYYHCNPEISRYTPDFWNKCKKMSAADVWRHDEERLQRLRDSGYTVTVVWESDFKWDPQSEVSRVQSLLNPM